MLDDLRRLAVTQEAPGGAVVAAGQLRGRRWDAGFWVGRQQLARAWDPTGASVDLGECLELLTYGPIVTGSTAPHVPWGVPSIRQSDFAETGLRRRGLLRVEPGSVHDPPRSRVRRGDVLLPRSGSGSLGRNRVAVYDEDEPANIGCFVDLIRLRPESLNPHYLWLFLRSHFGWGQIRSLINGVGTPNISFDEIRTLPIPTMPTAEQAQYEREYRQEVLPLHLLSADSEAARVQAEARFQDLVARLDIRLGAGRPGICP